MIRFSAALIIALLFSFCKNQYFKENDEFVASDSILIDSLKNKIGMDPQSYEYFESDSTGRIFYLALDHYILKDVPEEFYKLTELKEFKIEWSTLETLPDFSRFAKLEKLSFWGAKFPEVIRIGLLPSSMKSLSISNFQSKTKSIIFNKKSNLETFSAMNDSLTSLDGSINNLQNLKELWINNNQIKTFDLSGLPKLEKVWCYDNPLDTMEILEIHKNTKIKFEF